MKADVLMPEQNTVAISDDFALGLDGYMFSDLYTNQRLHDLFEEFRVWLARQDADTGEMYEQYLESRGEGWDAQNVSKVLIAAGGMLNDFLALLFRQETASDSLRATAERDRPILRFKRDFLQRRALKTWQKETPPRHEYPALNRLALAIVARAADPDADPELAMAFTVDRLVSAEYALRKYTEFAVDAMDFVKRVHQGVRDAGSDASILAQTPAPGTPEQAEKFATAVLDVFERVVVLRVRDAACKADVAGWVSFRLPAELDYTRLVHTRQPNPDLPEELCGPDEHLRRRDGFHLTDPRYGVREVLAESDYCVFCHQRDKDSCSKGLREKDGRAKKNPLGIELNGCPLDEKISEMQMLRNAGRSLGALAVIMVDNPMCPGTGHRICNDCMKSCIYQKQDPVNIPQIETGVLTDVLNLSYGPEIYFLLARWNPLNVQRPVALPYTGKNVLIAGMGPAGYTLAHYLLNEGYGVVGIDGLKIEPLDADLTGEGKDCPSPLQHFTDICSDLAERPMRGFGGVSEYGITVRWDKNFLTLLHLQLLRRAHFRLYGGVRFGGTMTVDDAWDAGFDHVAIATGAGRPTIVDMKNNMCRGMRMASDFLMALQLTGAAKHGTLANLQVQLPALVVGGGLTAVDTATELLAYYPVQVEKISRRYDTLAQANGEAAVRAMYAADELEILDRFREHAAAIRLERRRASASGEIPDFLPLLRSWGGVKLVYRKSMADAPAYRLNHEEIIKAFEEGISFIECLSPVEALLDAHDALDAVVFERQKQGEDGRWSATGEHVTLPARSLMIAAGTNPNTIIARENPGAFAVDSRTRYFIPHIVDDGELIDAPPGRVGFFTSYTHDGHYITYYGDNHPEYAGNVVKAMASAKHGYKAVAALLGTDSLPGADVLWERLVAGMDERLLAEVVAIHRYTPSIVEVTVKARGAAERFQPGQFYRVQNFERDAPVVDGATLAMEGLALTGAWVDAEKGLLSTIVLEMGTSSRLCATLHIGQKLVVMGPTGAPTEIPADENILLAGGGLGNAVLFSIARALKTNGCRVLYFAGYKRGEDLYRREDIEDATTQVIWSTDCGDEIQPHRPQDAHFRGNIVQSMRAYAEGVLGEVAVRLDTVTRIIAIGSDRMMAAVKDARHGVLAPYLRAHVGLGSINSPMQCMMKEICAQCLQRHIHPETGKEQFVYSCYFQDQELDEVDWKNLNDRLRQNTVMEKISNRYLDHLLEKGDVQRR